MKKQFIAIMMFALCVSLHAQFGLLKLKPKPATPPAAADTALTAQTAPCPTATAQAVTSTPPAPVPAAATPVTPASAVPAQAVPTQATEATSPAPVPATGAQTATPATATPTAPCPGATTATAPAATSPAAPAKFSFGKLMSGNTAIGNAVPGAQAVVLIKLVTLATDQGMQAMEIMASIFPPEKVAKFEESSKKYHEMKTNRVNGNIDADQCQVATDAAAEFAKLDADWSSYSKEKATVVPQADKRLAYMLLADGLAVTQLPGTVLSVKSDVTSMMSNPLQMAKAKQLGLTVVLLGKVSMQMPKQVESFKTVRGIVKKISVAENMTLAPDPAAKTLKDPLAFATAMNKDLPPEPTGAEVAAGTTAPVTSSTPPPAAATKSTGN